MKGGHARSGPPPDPNALRRDRDKAEWVHLPAAGRPGEPPEWPLTRATARERVLWAIEWARPQALMWEANGQELEVAVYVRTIALAEHPKAVVSARTLLRQQMDALGVTIPGLRMNRWVIDGGAIDAATDTAPAATNRPSVRDRLSLVVND
jgi:hypothetical protein